LSLEQLITTVTAKSEEKCLMLLMAFLLKVHVPLKRRLKNF